LFGVLEEIHEDECVDDPVLLENCFVLDSENVVEWFTKGGG